MAATRIVLWRLYHRHVVRSVILVSDDPDLFQSASDVLLKDPRFQASVSNLHCSEGEAPLTNIYPVVSQAAEWRDWAGTASEGATPNPRTMSNVLIESRSAGCIAEIGVRLAKGLASPAWFIDSADVAWPVGRVDPRRIALA